MNKVNVVYAGFTREELGAAFDLVKPSKDWKYPINARLSITTSDETLDAIEASINFFCGGDVCITKNSTDIVVTAPGYYMIIGA